MITLLLHFRILGLKATSNLIQKQLVGKRAQEIADTGVNKNCIVTIK